MPKIIKPAKGTFTTADITIDGSGRVISAASGSAGGGFQAQIIVKGGSSGTYAPPAAVSSYYAYAASGGGGGGSGQVNNNGGAGGAGGYGFFSGSVTGGTPVPYSVGSQGNAPAGAGGATTVANLFTVNGGGGGGNAPNNANGSSGSSGSAPGANISSIDRSFLFGPGQIADGGNPGPGQPDPQAPQRAGSPGKAGALVFFDNESVS